MGDFKQAARYVLRQFLENGTVEDMQGLKKTTEQLHKQKPGSDTARLLQALDTAIKRKQQTAQRED